MTLRNTAVIRMYVEECVDCPHYAYNADKRYCVVHDKYIKGEDIPDWCTFSDFYSPGQ